MTVERAREFLEAAAADPALQARLESAGSREEGWEAIRAAGYGDVTAMDLKAVVGAGAQGELTDAQLEGATGGSLIGKVIIWLAKNGYLS